MMKMWRISRILSTVFLGSVPVLVAGSTHARPLTSRQADRVLARAWQAELNGNYRLARASVEALAARAKTRNELAGRERLTDWLDQLAVRRSMFQVHGKTAPAYHRAYETLERATVPTREELWVRALDHVEDLGPMMHESAKVVLRIDQLKPLELPLGRIAALGRRLARRGIEVVDGRRRDARFEIRVRADSTKSSERGRDVEVVAEVTAVLRDLWHGKNVVGSVAKTRREQRRSENKARRFALRRALDDVADGVVYRIRKEILWEAQEPRYSTRDGFVDFDQVTVGQRWTDDADADDLKHLQ